VQPVPQVHLREVVLHGHRVTYREAGSGPIVLLLHGVAGSSASWEQVMIQLARTHRVIAPDLLGHGTSAKPRGDYSLGAYASGLRDLLEALGHSSATVVGHSLGGGVAMQMAYQFPERCERLVLVSSGGLGSEVTGWLRAATLPGAEWVLPLIAHRKIANAGSSLARLLDRLPPLLRPTFRPAVLEIARGYGSLADTETRSAFVHTLRSVVDVSGQRVSATDRLYLAADLPTLLVWGACDTFIPVSHAHATAELIPGARLEIFERAGHFPQLDEPGRFVRVLSDFLATSEAAHLSAESLRERLVAGG